MKVRNKSKKVLRFVTKKQIKSSHLIKLLLLFVFISIVVVLLSFFQFLVNSTQDLRSQAQNAGGCQSEPGGACGRGVDCCGSVSDPNHGNLGLACSIRTNFVGVCEGYNGGEAGMGFNCSCPLVDLNGDGIADGRDYNLFGERCSGKPSGWSDGQVTCFDYDGNGLVESNGRGADNDLPCLMSCIYSYRPDTCNQLKTQAECEGTSPITGPNCQWYPDCNLCDDPYNSAIPGAGVGCSGLTGMGQGISVTPTRVPNRPACSSVGSAGGLTSYCYENRSCGGGTHTCIYNTYDCAASECCCVPNQLAPTQTACRGVGSTCDATLGMCCSGLWCESGTCVDPVGSGLHNPPPTQPLGQEPTVTRMPTTTQAGEQDPAGVEPTAVPALGTNPTPSPSVSPETLADFINLLSNQSLLNLFIEFLRGLMGR